MVSEITVQRELVKRLLHGNIFRTLLIDILFRLINFFLLLMCHSVMTVHELSVNSKLLELPTSK